MDRELIPLLLIGTLGTGGAVALYLLIPRFHPIDLAMLIVVVWLGAAGYRQRIVRGIMTAVTLYLATGVAATVYPVPAPYIAAIGRFFHTIFARFGSRAETTADGATYRNNLAASFILVTVVIWATLEIIDRISLKDTHLVGLGILDNVGGIVIHLVLGILVASLLFNAIGYGTLRSAHDKALLRTQFNQVLCTYYDAQSFWFSNTPPLIYAYDLDVPRER